VRESQKYALFIFGAFAMFVLYKTVKHLWGACVICDIMQKKIK
jgi:hypothetical protein